MSDILSPSDSIDKNIVIGFVIGTLIMKILVCFFVRSFRCFDERPSTANQKSMDGLEAFNDICPICLGTCNHAVVAVGCKHQFCLNCFEAQFEHFNKKHPDEPIQCPLCRTPILSLTTAECSNSDRNAHCFRCPDLADYVVFYNDIMSREERMLRSHQEQLNRESEYETLICFLQSVAFFGLIFLFLALLNLEIILSVNLFQSLDEKIAALLRGVAYGQFTVFIQYLLRWFWLVV